MQYSADTLWATNRKNDNNKFPDLFRCYNSSFSNSFSQHRNRNPTSGIRCNAPSRYATTDLSLATPSNQIFVWYVPRRKLKANKYSLPLSLLTILPKSWKLKFLSNNFIINSFANIIPLKHLNSTIHRYFDNSDILVQI